MQQYTWFYSLKSPLSPEQVAALEVDFAQFLSKWNTHGTPVDGLITLKYNRFIIIQSDPKVARPSGCSIDSLKRAIGEILNAHRLEVVDSAYIFYRDGNDEIQSTHFSKIPGLVNDGTLRPETIVLDHSLDQSDDLSKWETAMENTWLNRYFPIKQKQES
ncbi:MAG: hypothetical protein KDD63_20045 [Bacteroidetes bacterium]|nr:hypothetical protein [Bacteroidota bacterium]